MSRNAVLPMDSYRLAQYAVEVPCYVCDGGNTFDAEMCRHCFAPMALARQSEGGQNVAPEIVATIGTSGAGKTVYLGMLIDMLSRRNDEMHLTARGAFSISLQQRAMAALSRCGFPDKTPSEPDRWNWVHGRIRINSRPEFDVIIPDMAGEAILTESEHPNTFPVVRAMLTKSTAVLLLIDAFRVSEGDTNQDFFAMKTLSYLAEVSLARRNGAVKRRKKKTIGPSVAVVFTKCDHCDVCFDDPAAFAKKYTPGLWQQCLENFAKHEFFATSVAGACGIKRTYTNVIEKTPLRVEPRGIIEPFRWILERA